MPWWRAAINGSTQTIGIAQNTAAQAVMNDTELVAETQQQVSELPSYGYRRVWGLHAAREKQSLPAINVKRVYRVMRDHNLLLERIKQPGVPRRHEGRIAVNTSTRAGARWLLEFRCDDGAKLSVTFALTAVIAKPSAGWPARPATAAMTYAT